MQIASNKQGELVISKTLNSSRILIPAESTVTPAIHRQGEKPFVPASPIRQNRFQLSPQMDQRAHFSTSPEAVSGPSRHAPQIPPAVDEVEAEDEDVDGDLLRGYSAWRQITAEDIGVVMRRRAEDGYGLTDVSR